MSSSRAFYPRTGTTSGTFAAGNDPRFTNVAPAAVTDAWTILSGRPFASGFTTATFAKDNWRLVPISLATALGIKGLTVETTVAATGGTAALIFATYAAAADGRPGTRLADLSTAGSIDLTATAGTQQLTGFTTTLPAGDFFLGCAWSGTASGNPTIRVLADSHPRIVDSNPVINRNAYVAVVSGATAPSSVTVSAVATLGAVHFGKLQ